MRALPLVSPLERALFLKAQAYLEGISPRMIAVLAEHSEERAFRPHETLQAGDAPPDTIFFLSTGGVRIEYPGPEPRPFVEIRAPAGIGVMEYLACSPEPPTTRAVAPTQALAVDTRVLMQLVEEDFLLFQSIARTLGRAVLGAGRALGPRRPPERGYPDSLPLSLPESPDLVQKLVRAREAPFFRDSNLTVLTELIRFQQPRRVDAGDTIWQRGDPLSSIALVLEGHCEAILDGRELAYPAGSVLGAWEIFALESRAETVRARRETRILEIDRTHLTDVLEDHFEFALDYLEKMASRTVMLRSLRPAAETSAGPVR